MNQLSGSLNPMRITGDIYFFEFKGHFPVGQHTFNVNLVDGTSIPVTVNVQSNEVMHTVSAFSQGLVFDKVQKGGKVVQREKDITRVNIQAREVTDVNGDRRLLISGQNRMEQ